MPRFLFYNPSASARVYSSAMAGISVLTLILLAMIMVMNGRVQVKALRVDMQRVWSRNITHAVHRSNARLKRYESAMKGEVSLAADLGAPVKSGQRVAEFMMTMGIGTPPRKMIGIVDTGSDLIWTQCKPCTACYSQPNPIFDPAKSTTYNTVSCLSSLCTALPARTCTSDCEYSYSYVDGSKTQGVLSNETFTLWDSSGKQESIPGLAFGCSHDTRGPAFAEADGLVGLGRGGLSLISQLGSTVGSKFSYCLTSFPSKSNSETSPLFFGSAADLKGTNIKSTPMVRNSARSDLNSFYYLSVNGISVGTTLANIPAGEFDIGNDGEGGFIIDSGTTITYLSSDAFDAVAQVLNRVPGMILFENPPPGLSLCYQVSPGFSFPDITFHMEGGADYVVEGEYNFIVDPESGIACLIMVRLDSQTEVKLPSILGNLQQQNLHILYDNDNEKISFTPATCEELAQPSFDPVSGSPASTLGFLSFIVFFIFPVIIFTLPF